MITWEELKYKMVFEKQELDGVYIIKPKIFEDNRGYFFESFRESIFFEKLNYKFIQDNEVYNKNKNIIRGLHYQLDKPQGKLIHVIAGSIMDVIVDIRIGSPDFGKYSSFKLDCKKHHLLFIPEGFAHGYLVLERNTIVKYKCTNYYDPSSEYGIKWNDSELNINWGVENPIISNKDNSLPLLKDQQNLPHL